MSRSNPNESLHPSTRWYKWNGEKGLLGYYDGENNIAIKPKGFIFLILDELATITGFDKANNCGIYSNEVKSTVNDYLTVKSFKGGEIAHGLYQEIKDTIKANGGKFTDNIHITFKNESGELVIGTLQLKGAAFSAWMDFKKANKKLVNEQAVRIIGVSEGESGNIKFKSPIFEIYEAGEETNEAAKELDRELQTYLTAYFIRQGKMPEREHFEPNEEYYKKDDEPTQEEQNQAALEAQAPEESLQEPSVIDDPSDDLPF